MIKIEILAKAVSVKDAAKRIKSCIDNGGPSVGLAVFDAGKINMGVRGVFIYKTGTVVTDDWVRAGKDINNNNLVAVYSRSYPVHFLIDDIETIDGPIVEPKINPMRIIGNSKNYKLTQEAFA